MIVAELKPFEDIRKMLRDHRKILVLGCGSCVTVCMSGGERQVELLASALRMAGGNDVVAAERTILRQCDPEFIDQIKEEAMQSDAVLSMACGAGVQGVAERLEGVPVLPAMNTTFIGVSDGKGSWVEVCAACGNCVLDQTGGICPVARCAKGLMYGPCGGSRHGMCEISKENPCAWQLIYERLQKLNKLHLLKEIVPAKKPVRPRKMVRDQVKQEKAPTKGA